MCHTTKYSVPNIVRVERSANHTHPQVLMMTSHLRTLLTVQNVNGEDVMPEHMVISPAVVSGLRPATNYTVTLVLVFLGGGEGRPLLFPATTMEGGKPNKVTM